ncbi:hypothetical protein L1S35_10635 [Flavobacterium sp. AS60]|uniref:hypothetical protein n=1 Tax=Flavobacterium anseongense TaxID=2910677 RepID=UPI001F3CC12E|nr:hypothetical protein [Flavobacterium sp. AS60]MCF6130133.1 hypothetical protein [Flavobacterium sp. AS60]
MREKIFEKRSENPNLDHLMSLFGNEIMAAFINGHLIIESLLVQFIEHKTGSDERLSKLNFPNKVKKCVELEYFDEKIEVFLLMINDIRNNYAHNLGYILTFDELFLLAENAGQAGIDFSDETIYLDKELSREWYGEHGIIQEIFQNTAMDLSFIMESHGGEFIFC